MKINLIFLLLISLPLSWGCKQAKNKWSVSSPDGKKVIEITLDEDQSLQYTVKQDEDIIIEPSGLGLVRADADFATGLVFSDESSINKIEENYRLVSGKSKECINSANELVISFKNTYNQKVDVILRAYNDGVAYKFRFPENDTALYTVSDERTEFNLPDSGLAWMHPYDTIVRWAPAYETFYENAIPIGTTAPWNKNGWAFPMLFHCNNYWILISEAGLYENYVGMHLQPECPDGVYRMRLPEKDEAYNKCVAEPSSSLPWDMPWRVIMFSKDIGNIVESNLITDLAKPNQLEDTSWIKPGRASWSWWSDGDSPKDYHKLKKFVDFSAEMGWEYSLVDANWDEMKGGDLEKLAGYAQEKNVGILAWYNSGGTHNTVTEKPRDLMWDQEKRRAEFKKLHSWGVKGVKVDFFQSDKQCIIQQYIDILKDAAEYKIVVNFHGCTLPRGWRRTYPNLLTMESIRGGEAYRFDDKYPEYGPVHQSISVFTRNVVGPMDYTPVGLSDSRYPHLTSYGFELAQAVLFESGIIHYCDDVEAYKALPAYALQFLKDIPADWDETRFIQGYPGKEVVLARRKGDVWYIAGINPQDVEKELKLDLSFLPENSNMKIIVDGEGNGILEIKEFERPDQLNIKVIGLGGFLGKCGMFN